MIIYLVAPFFKSKPYFSLTPSTEYRIKIETDILKAPYFVREEFFSDNQSNYGSFKRGVDK